MSSCPGNSLEDYLAWAFNLIVEDQDENNPSLGIAEMLGTATRKRDTLTKEEFAPIVKLFEDFRERVEQRLEDFDDDNQSWRDYAGSCFSDLPDYDTAVFYYLKCLNNNVKVPNPLVFSKQEMIEFLFKRGTDFAAPVPLESIVNNAATLSLGWCWKKYEDSNEFVAVRGDGEVITKEDVEHYVDMLTTSYIALHPEYTQSQETIMEYITKDTIRKIKPFVDNKTVLKNICDTTAILATHCHFDNSPQEDFAKAHISKLLREISSTFPKPIDYLTGNGPVANYLHEHLIIENIFSDQLQTIRNKAISDEIISKFNFNPSIHLDSIEWKNIIQTFIELQDKYLLSTDTDIALKFKPILPNEIISESGFYLYENTQRVINLVFRVNGILCTVSLMEKQDPLVNIHHEWEEANINIYNICYIPGMFKAITEEVSNLTA